MSVGTTSKPSRPREGDFSLSQPASSFADVARRVVLRPVGFFAAIPRRGNFAGLLIFALVCLETSAILRGLLGLASDQGYGVFVGSVVLTPLVGIVALLTGTAILHLLVRLVVGAENSGFEATFRVHSYAWVANLIAWIPIVGPLLSLYAIYLAFVGIREVHETTTARTALVVLIPVGAILVLASLALLVAGAAFLVRPV